MALFGMPLWQWFVFIAVMHLAAGMAMVHTIDINSHPLKKWEEVMITGFLIALGTFDAIALNTIYSL